MTVDRGGLRYNIEATDSFSSKTTRFISDIRESRKELLLLQRTARRGVDVKGMAADLRNARKESAKLSKDIGNIGRETGLVGKSLKEEIAARKQITREVSKANVETKKARRETDQQFRTVRRTIGTTRARARAEREITRSIDRRAVAEQRAAAALERKDQLTGEEFRKTQAVTTLEKERLRETEKLEKVQRRRADEAIRNLRTEASVQQRIAAAQQRSGVVQGLAREGRFDLLSKKELEGLETGRKRFQSLTDVLRRSENRANRVSFTFRRLFGILAAFAVVRELANAFLQTVGALIRVNAEVEQAQLGIASLLLATANVRNPFGDAVDSAEGLVLAQKEARRQTDLLRQDALRTTATFRTLLDTFQVAIAPGLASGLDIDEVRAFTVQISQAASAIGLQQNQLAEEIRSILQGTIQARTTRIAVSLGITNEDIRNAKEAGVLAAFLEDRFIAFNEAGKASFETFNGLVARIQDGFELLLTSGGVEFFDELKGAALELFQLLTNSDDLTGAITPDPGAVKVVQAIAGGLASALRSAVGITRSLSLNEVLGAARSFGTILATAAQVAVGLVEGLVQGFSIIGAAAGEVLDIVKDIFGITDGDSIRDIVRQVTTLAVVMLGIQIAVSFINGLLALSTTLLSILIAPLTAILGLVTAIQVLLAPVNLAILLVFLKIVAIVAIVALITEGFRRLLSSVAGVNLKLSTFAKILAVGVYATVKRVGIAFRRIGFYIQSGFTAAILAVGALMSEVLLGPLVTAASILEKLGVISKQSLDDIKQVQEFLGKKLGEEIDNSTEKAEQFRKEIADLKTETEGLLTAVLLGADDDPTVGDAASDILNRITGGIGDALSESVFGDLLGTGGALAQAGQEAQTLSGAFDDLAPSARRAVTTLESLSEISKKIRDDTRETADQLAQTQATLGLSGGAESLTTAAFQSQIRVREDAKKIDEDIKNLQDQIAQASRNRLVAEGRILELSADQRDFLTDVESKVREIQQIESRGFQIDKQRAIARAALAKATEEGLVGSIAEARENLEGIEDELSASREALALSRGDLDALGDLSEQYGLNIEEVRKLIGDRIELAGEEKGLLDDLNTSLDQRKLLEQQISNILAQRQASIATEAAFSLQQDNRQQALELSQKILDFENRNADVGEAQLENARLRVITEQQRLDIIREQGQRSINALTEQRERTTLAIQELERLRDLAESDQQRAAFQTQINTQKQSEAAISQLIDATQDQINLKLAEGNILLAQAAEEAERVRNGLERPLQQGLLDGIRNFVLEVQPLFVQISEIAKGALQDVGRVGSQVIADIFDPSKNVNLRQAVGRTLLGIGQQIVQSLISTLLARLLAVFVVEQTFEATKAANNAAIIAGWTAVGIQWQGISNKLLLAAVLLASSGGAGFAAGGPIGRADGGPMPTGRSAPKAPKGLHPSDKIPIWAAKDEFMIRASSALRYGHDVMQAINHGLVNPMALRALVGTGTVHRQVSQMPKRGLVSGGPVSASSTAADTTTFEGQGLDTAPTPAYLVADEQALEMLLANEQVLTRKLDELGYQRGS